MLCISAFFLFVGGTINLKDRCTGIECSMTKQKKGHNITTYNDKTKQDDDVNKGEKTKQDTEDTQNDKPKKKERKKYMFPRRKILLPRRG